MLGTVRATERTCMVDSTVDIGRMFMLLMTLELNHGCAKTRITKTCMMKVNCILHDLTPS
jgi:hypothetical protein